MAKYRIAIVGIGGVGGYIGGLLAAKYSKSGDIEIIFVARGENAKKIRENGLKLITGEKEQIVFPDLVSSDYREIGFVDLLICCVKSYDLTSSIEQLKNCISSSTFILPLENGVDASDKIRSIIPHANILDGCMYLNSRLIKPGIVKQIGTLQTLYFGFNTASDAELNKVLRFLKEAEIEAIVSDNMQRTLWEKFVFISALATVTTYADVSIGQVLRDKSTRDLLIALIHEVEAIAKARKIELPENIVEKVIEKASSVPFEATSSMHTDFKNNRRLEVDSLCGYVVRQGKRFSIPTPTYNKTYSRLELKQIQH